jgi:hypothetical protein
MLIEERWFSKTCFFERCKSLVDLYVEICSVDKYYAESGTVGVLLRLGGDL